MEGGPTEVGAQRMGNVMCRKGRARRAEKEAVEYGSVTHSTPLNRTVDSLRGNLLAVPAYAV